MPLNMPFSFVSFATDKIKAIKTMLPTIVAVNLQKSLRQIPPLAYAKLGKESIESNIVNIILIFFISGI